MTLSRKPVPMSEDTPVLHMLCGKAAAGKSTLCERLVTPRTIVIAQDHWMSKLYTEELQTVADYIRLVPRLRSAIGPHVGHIARRVVRRHGLAGKHDRNSGLDAEPLRSGGR